MDSIQQLDGSGLAPVIPVNRLLSCPRLNCLIDQKRHVRLDRFELPCEALSHFSTQSDKEFNFLLVFALRSVGWFLSVSGWNIERDIVLECRQNGFAEQLFSVACSLALLASRA